MTFRPATITTELLEHADGRPLAYIDATAVAVFAYQQPDGSYLVEICTREDITDGRLCVLLDGKPLIRFSAVTNDHESAYAAAPNTSDLGSARQSVPASTGL